MRFIPLNQYQPGGEQWFQPCTGCVLLSGAEDIAATANAVAQNYTDIKSLQNKTQDSTTTQKGIVQLTSSRVSESETLAATAKAAAMNYADIVALQGKTNDATTTN
ncbi:TPA: hypothetical protein JLJ30_004353, partial [Escherichia coli]|nr:hypothetical protein [Escherichia coli]